MLNSELICPTQKKNISKDQTYHSHKQCAEIIALLMLLPKEEDKFDLWNYELC